MAEQHMYCLCCCTACSYFSQLLELLRGITLTPESSGDEEGKAAAHAALDAAAEAAVAPLKEQQASALAVAAAAARNHALGAALGAQIRFSPGKPLVTPAVAAAVISVAADEVTAGLGSLAGNGASSDSIASGGLAARRTAAEQVMGMASILDSTVAALAAAIGDDESASEVLGELSESADKLQEVAIKYVQLRLKAESAKKPEGEEAAAAAEDQEAAAAAAVEEALQAVRAAAEKLSGLSGPAAAEGQAGEGEGATAATAESIRQAVLKMVEEKVAAVEEMTKQQHDAALQVCLWCGAGAGSSGHHLYVTPDRRGSERQVTKEVM